MAEGEEKKTGKTNRNWKMIMAGITIIIITLSINASADEHTYTKMDNNLNISLNSGEKFNISLEEQSGTGYVWEIQSYDSSVLLVVQNAKWTLTGPPGQPEIHNWTFEGIKNGNTSLILVNYRPWEGNSSIIDTFTLNISVNNYSRTSSPWLLPIYISIGTSIMVLVFYIIKWRRKHGEKK